ncbi:MULTISPECIES: DUF3566 domain-containing protein [unclassified Streptomyces]|uniref:DUF3566 domain-containing protein n=1 Tax=unclassified Streptomyces TaxID=2593676 RepID=UPI0029ACA95B|nr:DUF3566 domain-containing protein [Streptomyces sp. ME18-1-4]MDX3241512.1 DUF3566 domain-containing protein [Streptomyces sp. ME18-1-4]
MSGATGAGTSAGTDKNGGGRGSAAPGGNARTTDARGAGGGDGRPADTHTTQLKAIKAPVADSPSPSSSPDTQGSKGSQGGTVTDTRGAQAKQPAEGSPLPGERQPQQPAGPYHPPQAYPTQAPPAPAGAVRRPRTGVRTTPRVRKARLRVSKADPWSVMKVSFLLSIALGICTIVAAAVLWMVMDAMGVFSSVGGTIAEATGSNESNGFDLQAFLSLPHVLMFTSIIAVIDVVLATALATLGAFIYNLSAGFVGGVELTLAEDE